MKKPFTILLLYAATIFAFAASPAIANIWDGEDLLASFFMRSDNPSGAPLWTGTSAAAVFSSFRILEGSATAIPGPTTAALVLIGCLGIVLRRNTVNATIR